MAKRRGKRISAADRVGQASSAASSQAGQALEGQIQSLVNQRQYAQAIRKLQQGLKKDPSQTVSLTEADLWLMEGKQALDKGNYPRAEKALQTALSLGLYDDAYYWLAKCWLSKQQPDRALTLLETAFQDKTLPKALGGCYLKVLFLMDRGETVAQLVETQSKRFYAYQLHWARGALALKAGEPETASTHFRKGQRPATPGDWLIAWQAYAHQQAKDWTKAESLLQLRSLATFRGRLLSRSPLPRHPAIGRLMLVQLATQHDLMATIDIEALGLSSGEKVGSSPQSAGLILQMLARIERDDVRYAGHSLLKLSSANSPLESGVLAPYPDLQALYRPMLLLAGQQALQSQQPEGAEQFWQLALKAGDFDPHLALHLYKVSSLNESDRLSLDVAQRLFRWVKSEAKRQPNQWPTPRLNATLAQLHCWQADKQVRQGLRRDGVRNVRAAEKLDADHPEVLGRRGLIHIMDGEPETAIPLLTEALEKGCRYDEAYFLLIETLEEMGDKAAHKAIRRQYGKHFGDFSAETEIDLPDWLEALSYESYDMLEELVVPGDSGSSPAMEAIGTFLSAAEDINTSTEKLTLQVAKAEKQWNKLLAACSSEEKLSTLQTIVVLIQRHARRNKKGVNALQGRYLKQVADLSPQLPSAREVHLVLYAIKLDTSKSFEALVNSYLTQSSQPGRGLAKVQLQARQLGQTAVLRHKLQELMERESQNPLLMLALATCHPRNSLTYQELFEQGFELARRLQDAEALQACREEEWFRAQSTTRKVLGPNLSRFNDPSQLDIPDMIRRMAKEMFGQEVPPEILAQMIPMLEAEMAADLPHEFEDEFEDEEPDFDFFTPPRRRKKKKPWFEL